MRLYTDTSHSYSILRGAVLQGLGQNTILKQWPQGRSYYDVGYFRSPYARNYFQDGSLMGLGASPPPTVASSAPAIASAVDQAAPPHVKRFLLSGEPVPTLENNATLPFNQIPRWLYGVLGAGAAGLSYLSYQRYKKAKRTP